MVRVLLLEVFLWEKASAVTGSHDEGNTSAVTGSHDEGNTSAVTVSHGEENASAVVGNYGGEDACLVVALSDIRLENVSSLQREKRPIYNGNNAGNQSKSTSQTRILYADNGSWPLINAFPSHVLNDPTAVITLDEFLKYCPPFIILPDFYKHWALEVGNRSLNPDDYVQARFQQGRKSCEEFYPSWGGGDYQ